MRGPGSSVFFVEPWGIQGYIGGVPYRKDNGRRVRLYHLRIGLSVFDG